MDVSRHETSFQGTQTDGLSSEIHPIWLTFEDPELEKNFRSLRSASIELRWRSYLYIVVWLVLALYHELPWRVSGYSNWIVGVAASAFPVISVGVGIAMSYNAIIWQRYGEFSVLCSTFVTVAAVLASSIWKFHRYPESQGCPINDDNCPSFATNPASVGVFSLVAIWVNLMSHLLFATRVPVSAVVFLAFVMSELATSRTVSSAYYIGIMATVAVRRSCSNSAISSPPFAPTASTREEARIAQTVSTGALPSAACAQRPHASRHAPLQ
jgi:hypothetical protein